MPLPSRQSSSPGPWMLKRMIKPAQATTPAMHCSTAEIGCAEALPSMPHSAFATFHAAPVPSAMAAAISSTSTMRLMPEFVSPKMISRRALVNSSPGTSSISAPMTQVLTLSVSPSPAAAYAASAMAKAATSFWKKVLVFTCSSACITIPSSSPQMPAHRLSRSEPPKNTAKPQAASTLPSRYSGKLYCFPDACVCCSHILACCGAGVSAQIRRLRLL